MSDRWLLFSFGWRRSSCEPWLFVMSGVSKTSYGCSDLIKRDGGRLRLRSLAWVTLSSNLDHGLSRELGMAFWWTSALVLVCGGFDRQRAAMQIGFGWEIDVGDWLGGGGALGGIKVVGERLARVEVWDLVWCRSELVWGEFW